MTDKIVKSAAWLFSGTLIGRTLRAFVLMYSARVLGASAFGAFSLALSLSAIFTILSDLGVNSVMVREGVKSDETRKKYFSSSFFLKFPILIVLSIVAVFISSAYSQRMPDLLSILPYMILIFVFDSFRDLLCALARSYERMDLDAKCQIITNFAIVVFCGVSLYFVPSAISVMQGYALGTLIGVSFILFALRKRVGSLINKVSPYFIKEVFLTAWSFGLVALMGVITINTDNLVIGFLMDQTSVGLYSAALKPIQFLYIIPAALSSAVFPSLAMANENMEEFKKVFSLAIRSGYLFAFPLAVGGILTAKSLMVLLYGPEFIGASAAFILLSLTLLFVFPSLFITNALFAGKEKNRIFLTYALIGIFGNTLLDILLINVWGIAGSALATLTIQIILFLYVSYHFKKSFGVKPTKGLSKIVVSSAVMGLSVAGLSAVTSHVLVVVGGGAAVYLGLLILLREETLKQLSLPLLRKIGMSPEWLGEQ